MMTTIKETVDNVTERHECMGGCGDEGFDHWDMAPPGFWCCDCLPPLKSAPVEWRIDDD